jgi:hypothetical protein
VAGSSCSIKIWAGLKHARRAVAFLEQHSASYVDIKAAFDKLKASAQRYHFKSFDFYLGNHKNDDRHHGWNQSQHNGKYTECYVFKNLSEKERLYGFLCRPKEGNPEFEMCVLILYAKKKTWNTDTTELDRAERMCTDPDVIAALQDPDLFITGEGKSNE